MFLIDVAILRKALGIIFKISDQVWTFNQSQTKDDEE